MSSCSTLMKQDEPFSFLTPLIIFIKLLLSNQIIFSKIFNFMICKLIINLLRNNNSIEWENRNSSFECIDDFLIVNWHLNVIKYHKILIIRSKTVHLITLITFLLK